MAWVETMYGFLVMTPALFYNYFGSVLIGVGVLVFTAFSMYLCRPVRFLFFADAFFRFAICFSYAVSFFVFALMIVSSFGYFAIICAVVLSAFTFIFMWLYKLEKKLEGFGWKNVEK
ncbi:hypothetical protein ACLD02_04315 [Alloalcanivorax sp. C16-2]|uniref:hypothetical protein n=1 Tax=Alloalcanivorax sp. C16-2 TaxID=3390052 RepID=UPI003970E148